MTEHIEHRIEDGITYITINDPKNGNRVSDPMAEELSLQIDAASETSKAVVLRTMGNDFCLGRSIMGEKPGKLPEAYVMRENFDVIFNFSKNFIVEYRSIIGTTCPPIRLGPIKYLGA